MVAVKPRPNALSPEELQEFKLRQATLDQARCNYLLVQEAYQVWVREVGRKHRVRGKFTIDMQTGGLTPVVSENGHARPDDAA